MTQACNHLPLMAFCSSAFSLYKNLIECTRIQKPYKILSNPLMSFWPVHQTVIEGFPNVLNSPFKTSTATHNPLLCCPSVCSVCSKFSSFCQNMTKCCCLHVSYCFDQSSEAQPEMGYLAIFEQIYEYLQHTEMES